MDNSLDFGEITPERAIEVSAEAADLGIAYLKWLGDHEAEINQVNEAAKALMVMLGVWQSNENPAVLKCVEECTRIMRMCLDYGFYMGRTYQDVPKVFKEGME